MPSMLHCLQALGYIEVETQGATVLGPPGLRFRGHQFRYSELRLRKMSSAATGFIVVAEARRFERAITSATLWLPTCTPTGRRILSWPKGSCKPAAHTQEDGL